MWGGVRLILGGGAHLEQEGEVALAVIIPIGIQNLHQEPGGDN